MLFLSFLLFIWLPCGLYTGNVAEAKGLNSGWGWGGFLFGPIALVAAVGMPNQTQMRILRLIAEKQGVDLDFADAVESKEYKALQQGIDQSMGKGGGGGYPWMK